MKSKISVFYIALLLILSLCPAVVHASSAETGSGFSSASEANSSDEQILLQSQTQSSEGSESGTETENGSLIPMLIRVSVVIIGCELVAVCVIIVIKKKRTIR